MTQHSTLLNKSPLVAEQYLTVAYRNHIVVKHPLIDDRGVLLGEHHPIRMNLIETRYRLARLQSLARRIALGCGVTMLLTPIDKELKTRFTVFAAETVMVCRSLVAKARHLRQRRMHGEA